MYDGWGKSRLAGMAGTLRRLIADLERPAAYTHAAGAVHVLQTHISYVLLAGEYAYKIKKPLDLGFLDYSTLGRRRRMCEDEVRLNRRLCDGVYLGVVAVTRGDDGTYRFGGPGEPVEYAVQMRRVRDEDTMPHLLAAGSITREHLASLAERIASFHRTGDTNERIASYGRAPVVRANWDENFAQTAPYIGRTIDRAQFENVRSYVDGYLAAHGSLIEERAGAGRVRDGHGDLRADSVVFAADGSVCVMDCIEFSDRLRCCDIASDVAFLAMDLEFRGHRREADEFVSLYMESRGGDETLTAVLNFYRAYRAFVRGKVDSIQSGEAEVPDTQRLAAIGRARRYFRLSQSYAARSYPRAVIMMVGLSGTGKSFVARAFAGRAGAVLLGSDPIRHELAPPDTLEPSPYATGVYAAAQRESVYAELIERARRHLALNRSVVLDATFLTRRQRSLAQALAAAAGVPLLTVHVDAPETVVRERLAARGPGAASDARWDTYLAQRDRFEPLDDVVPPAVVGLSSTRALDVLVDEALHGLESVAKSGRSARRLGPNGPS